MVVFDAVNAAFEVFEVAVWALAGGCFKLVLVVSRAVGAGRGGRRMERWARAGEAADGAATGGCGAAACGRSGGYWWWRPRVEEGLWYL